MLEIKCGACKGQLYHGDEIYCEKCYQTDEDLISDLYDTIDKLEKQIIKLGGEIFK